jgi:hypothetical protein
MLYNGADRMAFRRVGVSVNVSDTMRIRKIPGGASASQSLGVRARGLGSLDHRISAFLYR